VANTYKHFSWPQYFMADHFSKFTRANFIRPLRDLWLAIYAFYLYSNYLVSTCYAKWGHESKNEKMFIKKCCKLIEYINWRDVQRKNVVNNVDMSRLRAPWQNGSYTEKHAKQQKTCRTPRRNKQSEIKLFLWFSIKFINLILM